MFNWPASERERERERGNERESTSERGNERESTSERERTRARARASPGLRDADPVQGLVEQRFTHKQQR